MTQTNATTAPVQFRPRHDQEPEWLYDLRSRSWRAWETSPLPDRVVHLWRYTEPQRFVPDALEGLLRSYPVMPNGHADQAKAVPDNRVGHAYNDTSLLTLARLTPEAAKMGVVLTDLLTAVHQHPDLIREYLGSAVGENFDKFETLNLALWNTGLFLYVPDGVVLDKPIHLHRTSGNGDTLMRLLAVVGENSEVTIIDDYEGQQGVQARINSVVELIAKASSRVTFSTFIRLADEDSLFLTQRNRIGQDVSLRSSALSLGAGLTKVNWGTQLEGRGADSRWTGLLMGGDEQHFDNHTLHRHMAGETCSNLEFKVALKDRAVSSYTGRINIEPHAAFCEAYQENRNLLLSDAAKVESIPELEIVNDDVKCSHGVTVGMLEPEQLFYLTSRGIEEEEARRIILAGFFEEPLAQVPQELRELGHTLLMQKLEA
ncbi:MAG: Fe-S cluster assembly protein SufD [bacterium]